MTDEMTGGRNVAQADHAHLMFDPREALHTVIGHRRRFASSVATLTEDQLAEPSRCDRWSVADVLRHGIWVDETLHGIWTGRRFPAGFDPRTTPNEFVDSHRDVPDEEIRRRYLVTTEAMVLELEAADTDRYSIPSRSPLGRVPWWFTVVHCGWDSSIHERDALLPLGCQVDEWPDETTLFLAYGLVLASFFAGPDPLAVRVNAVRLRNGNGPVTAWTNGKGNESGLGDDVSFDEPVTELSGNPVPIIDALSGRGHLAGVLEGPQPVVDRLNGLAQHFSSTA